MDVKSCELPFYVEYARSSRATCKGCKTTITQQSLRIAVMVQSAFYDGKQPQWYHSVCFFRKQRPESVGDFGNYESLRFEDQKQLEEEISNFQKPGKNKSNLLQDFGIEYAKSGRAACRGCELKIIKDELRIRKTVFVTEVGMKFGGQALWHHAECFAQIRKELCWHLAGKELPGYNKLSKEDKERIDKILPAITSDVEPPAKKLKSEKLDKEEEKEKKQEIKLLKAQNERLFKNRDKIRDEMAKSKVSELLFYNNQQPVTGDSEKLYDQAADMLTFGALAPCSKCGCKEILFTRAGYVCQGNLSEWTKCDNVETDPKRSACKVPKELKEIYAFLTKVSKKPEKRVIQYVAPGATTILRNVALAKKEDEIDGPKVKREKPPLYNLTFSYIGLKKTEIEKLKKRIATLGGVLTSRITDKTIAVISTEAEVKRMGSQMCKAMESGLHVLPVDYVAAVESDADGAIKFINGMTLCDWGKDPTPNIAKSAASKSSSIYTKSVPKSVALKLKDGVAVDPASGLDCLAHVYVDKKNKYNVVLGLTDVQRNKNSFYKLQLLECDTKKTFWVFRSWGRIGTSIGDTKLERFDTLYEAIDSFKEVYLQKTGNDFENRLNFVKLPNRMYEIDIDYSDKNGIDLSAQGLPESKLHANVQNLIKLLFDVDSMKRAMLEFHLDLEKMPLGKISTKQINLAYKVLSEVQELLANKATNAGLVDATNRFYTLIPHNFGVKKPPLIENAQQIESLCQVLDSLTEIECAYSFIKTEFDKTQNPIDAHYEQLKTNIEPLDTNTEEYALIAKYVQNTHAETHKTYELVIKNIFKVSRQGEARRYKPFKKLHNRKLLWHGSRLTNYVGILSHGLKIAPPEAPVTGYMFGKGIYFADMVSKSANYCFTSQENSTGLLLLSEVACGDMLECTEAKNVKNLPKGKHSCFGAGRTAPDPNESHFRPDGVEIPLGTPKIKEDLKSSLLYNEYIVYDIAQVNIQYLLVTEFKYKY